VNAANIRRRLGRTSWRRSAAQRAAARHLDATALLAVQAGVRALLGPLTHIGVAMIPTITSPKGASPGAVLHLAHRTRRGRLRAVLPHRGRGALWLALVGAGRAEPCGLGARDTLRLEAASPLLSSLADYTLR